MRWGLEYRGVTWAAGDQVCWVCTASGQTSLRGGQEAVCRGLRTEKLILITRQPLASSPTAVSQKGQNLRPNTRRHCRVAVSNPAVTAAYASRQLQ